MDSINRAICSHIAPLRSGNNKIAPTVSLAHRAIAQLVARIVRDDEAVSSNLTSPTNKNNLTNSGIIFVSEFG